MHFEYIIKEYGILRTNWNKNYNIIIRVNQLFYDTK